MKYGLIFLLFINILIAEGQQLSVKSFRKLENDLSARGQQGRLDQNGERCAILKIVTTQRGFNFEPDVMGSMGFEQKKGEIWLYIPRGAKRLSIGHSQYGILKDYVYPEKIEAAIVYEMVIDVKRKEDLPSGHWLVMSVWPKNAKVNINGHSEVVNNGVMQKFLEPGFYDYRVEAPLFETSSGKIEISGSESKELIVRLQRLMGKVRIISNPEGARIKIDSVDCEQVTPCEIALATGISEIRLSKIGYLSSRRKVEVKEKEVAVLNLSLQPDPVFIGAQKGNPGNQYTIGERYWKGIDCLQNDEEAIKWFRKAAEENLRIAKRNLALLLYKKDKESIEAIKWFRSGAMQGDDLCLYYMGLLTGQDSWYKRAAEAGNADALNKLGMDYEKAGLTNEAYEYYQKAEKKGHAGARYNLGRLCYKFSKWAKKTEDQYKWKSRAINFKYPEALYDVYEADYKYSSKASDNTKWKYLKQVAEAGSWEAQKELATEYYGKGRAAKYYGVRGIVEQDWPEAVKWYKMALQSIDKIDYSLSDTESRFWNKNRQEDILYCLGEMFMKGGYGLEQNLEEAEKYYRQGYDLNGNIRFCDLLGDLCVKRNNYEEAYNFFVKSGNKKKRNEVKKLLKK